MFSSSAVSVWLSRIWCSFSCKMKPRRYFIVVLIHTGREPIVLYSDIVSVYFSIFRQNAGGKKNKAFSPVHVAMVTATLCSESCKPPVRDRESVVWSLAVIMRASRLAVLEAVKTLAAEPPTSSCSDADVVGRGNKDGVAPSSVDIIAVPPGITARWPRLCAAART